MLGSRVTLIEGLPRILTPVDEALALALEAQLRADGVALHTGATVDRIEGDADCHSVQFRTRDGEAVAVASQVVALVVGRHPAIAGLGLETTAVVTDAHGIKVNDILETGGAGIFAVGDVVGARCLRIGRPRNRWRWRAT